MMRFLRLVAIWYAIGSVAPGIAVFAANIAP